MSEALTLEQAAEAILPMVQMDDSEPQLPATSTAAGSLNLEHAADLISERLSGKPATRRKRKHALTVAEAAKEIAGNSDNSKVYLARWQTAHEALFTARAGWVSAAWEMLGLAGGMQQMSDDQALAASMRIQVLSQDLRQWESAGTAAWNACLAIEDEAFLMMHPDLSMEDRHRAVHFLIGCGLEPSEIEAMWTQHVFIDMGHPIAAVVVGFAAGSDDGERMVELLKEIGFDQDTLAKIAAGETRPHLRDHRIQELVFRASRNGIETRQDRAAA